MGILNSPILTNKNVLIGISGGIAAYKIPSLIRILRKNNANVKVVATESALEFVTITTLETLSSNKVYHSVFDNTELDKTKHISLTDWADIFIVAPATGNIIGKYAAGIADDALSTALMAFDKKVIMAPAMNVKMYNHFATQRNISFLKENGVVFIEGYEGFLACGYEGKGRMAEVDEIFNCIKCELNKSTLFEGKKVVITAARTEEYLDPVRFLTNKSSGKMGFKIAEAFYRNGAEVTLITGPSTEKIYNKIKRVDILSAEEMFLASSKYFENADIFISSAAVADYTFEKSENKLKKDAKKKLEFLRTKDILAELGKKKKQQILVGFALETEDAQANALAKLASKNLDLIVMNKIEKDNPALRSDYNLVSFITREGTELKLPKQSKEVIGENLTFFIKEQFFNF